MTRHPLTGVQSKLKRASKHFEALHNVCLAWFTPDRYPTDACFDEQTGWKTVHVRVPEQPPDEWGTVVGEAMFQLRSALDQLVYQLALLNNATLGGKRTQFPIFTNAEDYFRTWRDRMLYGVADEHRAVIDSFQPYHRVNPDRDPLAILKALHDADEHRDIQAVVILANRPNIKAESVEDYSIGDAQFRWPPLRAPLTDDAEIVGIKLWPDPYAKVKMDIEARFEVAFEPAHATMGDLDRIRRHVERIIRRFLPAFPA